MRCVLSLALALALACGAAHAEGPAPAAKPKPLRLDSHPLPLVGALRNPQAWSAWKTRFLTEGGRVIDTGNGRISHSEGQGYGLVLAVAANDRPAFERIWGWTRANMMVRDDALVAWRWEPDKRPAVSDMNDASDGDMLIAWGLTEAAEAWGEVAHRTAARRIAVELGRKLIVSKTRLGPYLLPAVAGFAAEDRADGPILNLSYWVFPALARLPLVAPEYDWSGVAQSGLALLKAAQFGAARLPSDWISAHEALRPADGFAPEFSYNSVRIPLYLAWAGLGEREHYDAFAAWAHRKGGRFIVNVASGAESERFVESGYGAVALLTLCAAEDAPLPAAFRTPRSDEHYYPATLHLLAVTAAQMRYGACFKN